jgi:type II secretory pathway component PulF
MDSKKIGKKFEQFMFKSAEEARTELYDVIIGNLEFGINIKSIIERRITKHHNRHLKKGFIKRVMGSPGGSEMPFLKHTNETLLKGGTFSESVKGWVSFNEIMLIESGGDGQLRDSLQMAKDLLADIKKIKSSLKSKMTQPVILFIVLNILILAFTYSMLPILISLSDPETWEGSAAKLYSFLIFFKTNVNTIYISLAIAITAILQTLSIWTGKVRDKFDLIIPWSIYKEFNAGIFLISLSTLIKSGMTLLMALESLRKQAPRYVRVEIDRMIKNARAAESNSGAINTGFLGDIGDDIEDMAEFGGFEETLLKLGEKSINQIIENISSKGDKVKAIMMILVIGFVGWGYGTFITISQSITDNI